jgi:hypothetical protein
VTVLWPDQFGWRVADAEGKVTLRFSSLPPDGTIIGMAEHASEPSGALFAIKRGDAKDAAVQLFPSGTVKGQVVDAKQKPIEGVVVAGLFSEGSPPLWRTVTDANGAFLWQSIVPQVRQRGVVLSGDKSVAEVPSFAVEASGIKDVGSIVASEATPGVSVCGKGLEWYDNKLASGDLPERKACKGAPAVVVYCSPADAPMIVEGLAVAHGVFSKKGVLFAVVVDGPYTGGSAPFPVLSGRSPGRATTYVVGSDGNVVLETFGMPPVRALQRIVAAKPSSS